MIVVSVQLHSAVSGEITELARMEICNEGTNTSPARGDYEARVLQGRSSEAFAKRRIQRETRLANWPRQQLHVWNLVAAMLSQMGYGKK